MKVIELLQTIADPVQGTNLKYRYENKILIEKEEVFRHSFYDKRMAYLYLIILKDVSHSECTLTETKEMQYRKFSRKVEVLNDENILQNQIQYYYEPSHEIWRYDLVFKTSIKNIINQ